MNFSDNLPFIKAHSVELEQAFSEIFINGIEAIGKRKGSLIINVDKYGKQGQYIKIEVSDTGKGIHNNDINKIFDFFYTTKGKNRTGLGLSLAHRIIRQYNGWIDVKSVLNKGTVFTVYLLADNPLFASIK